MGMPELIIVSAVVVLVAGSSQLPKLARSLGSMRREYEKAANEGQTTERPDDAPSSGRHFA